MVVRMSKSQIHDGLSAELAVISKSQIHEGLSAGFAGMSNPIAITHICNAAAIATNEGVIQINFNPVFIDNTFQVREDAFFVNHKQEVDSLKLAGMDEWNTQEYL